MQDSPQSQTQGVNLGGSVNISSSLSFPAKTPSHSQHRREDLRRWTSQGSAATSLPNLPQSRGLWGCGTSGFKIRTVPGKLRHVGHPSRHRVYVLEVQLLLYVGPLLPCKILYTLYICTQKYAYIYTHTYTHVYIHACAFSKEINWEVIIHISKRIFTW